MRWDRLFEDLEASFASDERSELDAEVADRTRRERALLDLQARLLAHVGRGSLTVRLASGALTAALVDVGPDWLLLDGHAGRTTLVPLSAVRGLTGLTAGAAEASIVARRFTMGAALRGLSRDRAPVEIADVDGVTLVGTIDSVGADHLDLAEHASDEPRRARNVVRHQVLPFAALAWVRRI